MVLTKVRGKKFSIKCPGCKTTDFDIDEDGKNGYCIIGCNITFTINKDGTTKKSGHIQRETHKF